MCIHREFRDIRKTDLYDKVDTEFSNFRKIFKTSIGMGKTDNLDDSEDSDNEDSVQKAKDELKEEINIRYLDLWKDIYNEHKKRILTEDMDDSWIINSNIELWYGSNSRKGGLNHRNGSRYAYSLTNIYRYAIDIEKKYSDNNDDDEESDFSDILLLYIYEIFLLVIDKKNRKERVLIQRFIQELKDDLGIEDETDKKANMFSSLSNILNPDTINNVGGLVSQVVDNLGIEGAPTGAQIKKMISPENIANIASPENIKLATDTFKGLTGQGQGNNQENIKKITEKFKNMSQTVKKSLSDDNTEEKEEKKEIEDTDGKGKSEYHTEETASIHNEDVFDDSGNDGYSSGDEYDD
uniref:Uncharacterized protein n=1 Tax=Pithovirus LCPAC101 TaxID=2506586 RepID=A0A481Z2E6_9VIRU|nr:MAG: hypothetical protein LCPAC101_01750 [Pithovirus LCPAC101]